MNANNQTSHSAAVFVTDRKYLLGTRVAVRSLLFNSMLPGLTVCIVCDESVSTRERQRLAALHPSVRVAATSNAHRQRLHTTAHYSHAMYLKFDLPALLPDLDKALYLDADTVVLGSLRELWDMELGDDYAAAVEERGMSAGLARYVRERLEFAGRYFNSGVLLLNLAALRRDNMTARLAEFTAARPWLGMPDQDAFNMLFGGRVRFAAREFNYMTMYHAVPGYALTVSKPRVVHYADWRKPWLDARVPFGAEFRLWLTVSERLRCVPRWLVPVLFYEKHAYLGEVERTFKFFGLPLYKKWKNETAWETRVLGLKFAGKYGEKKPTAEAR